MAYPAKSTQLNIKVNMDCVPSTMAIEALGIPAIFHRTPFSDMNSNEYVLPDLKGFAWMTCSEEARVAT